MARFTIKEEHDSAHHDSKRVMESLTRAGSYFLKHATWGCNHGDHSARLCVEADCEEDVRLMVPPVLRSRVTVTPIFESIQEGLHE